jgi:hypothetical protein
MARARACVQRFWLEMGPKTAMCLLLRILSLCPLRIACGRKRREAVFPL